METYFLSWKKWVWIEKCHENLFSAPFLTKEKLKFITCSLLHSAAGWSIAKAMNAFLMMQHTVGSLLLGTVTSPLFNVFQKWYHAISGHFWTSLPSCNLFSCILKFCLVMETGTPLPYDVIHGRPEWQVRGWVGCYIKTALLTHLNLMTILRQSLVNVIQCYFSKLNKPFWKCLFCTKASTFSCIIVPCKEIPNVANFIKSVLE